MLSAGQTGHFFRRTPDWLDVFSDKEDGRTREYADL
jgi:hypothetical protein